MIDFMADAWIRFEIRLSVLWNRNVNCRRGKHQPVRTFGDVRSLKEGRLLDSWNKTFCIWCMKELEVS